MKKLTFPNKEISLKKKENDMDFMVLVYALAWLCFLAMTYGIYQTRDMNVFWTTLKKNDELIYHVMKNYQADPYTRLGPLGDPDAIYKERFFLFLMLYLSGLLSIGLFIVIVGPVIWMHTNRKDSMKNDALNLIKEMKYDMQEFKKVYRGN